MDKVINELLHLKQLREDKAQREVTRARRALDDADGELNRARSELEDHRAHCNQQERELYAEICRRQVRLRDLQDVSLKVDEFKQSIQGHETSVEEARDRRTATADCLGQAVQVLQVAVRVRQNFTELREVACAEALVEQSRAEDAELEEVPPRRVQEEEHVA